MMEKLYLVIKGKMSGQPVRLIKEVAGNKAMVQSIPDKCGETIISEINKDSIIPLRK